MSRMCVRHTHPCASKLAQHDHMNNVIEIGKRIKLLRKELGLKQADFVAGLDVSRSYLSKLETGEEQPGRDLLIRMAQEFKISLDWLASGSGEMRPATATNEQEALLLFAFRSLPPDEAETHLKLMLQRAKKDRPNQM